MNQFNFTLQAVLDERCSREDQAQRQLARLLRQKLIIQTQLLGLYESLDVEKEAACAALTRNVNLATAQRHTEYRSQLRALEARYASQLQDLETRIAAARQRLTESIKRRKSMECLRDRHRAQWRAQQQQSEARQHDELALHLHARGMHAPQNSFP